MKPGGPARNHSEPALEGRFQRFISGASTWSLPKPFSKRDWLGALILVLVALCIWYIGDFHTFHYSDDLIHSLNSLYQWTPLSWESDHIGSFLALLVRFIRRPYWNVLAISTLSSLLFLGGLTVWTCLLSGRKMTLIEGVVWVLLLLPLVVTKHRIFDNASHGSTFGSGFFFAALFIMNLETYLNGERRGTRLFGMLMCGFLTVYLSTSIFIPLAVITSCLTGNEFLLHPQNRSKRSLLELIAPTALLTLALISYQVLAQTVPTANIYGMSLANVSISLPLLAKNWSLDELTSPILILIPIALLIVKPVNPLIGYLTAGVVLESLIISSTGWVINYHFSGYYLTDLTFLLLLTIVLLASQSIRTFIPPHLYPRLLPVLASAALALSTMLWNSFNPILPFTAMDKSIGARTHSFVEAGCDILAGDYWKTWPIALAANDHNFRNHIIDARTGEPRLAAVISLRAGPTEYLWRERLDWPTTRICGLAGDEVEMQSYMARYAPDRALFLVNPVQFEGIIAYELANRHLTELRLEFDLPVPGEGWSYLERTPTGETFVWMKSMTSTLYLPLATVDAKDIEFRVIFAMAPDISESLVLEADDRPIPLVRVREENGSVIFRGLLPPSGPAAEARATILTFHINRLLTPLQVMPNSDDRRGLGVAFDWLSIR